MPSPFCHEILNANPYAYLDDAPLEERRARAVEMRRSLPPDLAGDVGALGPAAFAEVAEEAWPVVRDADELHDALLTLIWVPEELGRDWAVFLPTLLQTGRAAIVVGGGPAQSAPPTPTASSSVSGWVATERLATVRTVFPAAEYSPAVEGAGAEELQERDEAIRRIVQGWMELPGQLLGCRGAGSGRIVRGKNGVIVGCSHGFTVSRSGDSGGKSSRSRRPTSCSSCFSGSMSQQGRGSTAKPVSWRSSGNWPDSRPRPPPWSGICCQRGYPNTILHCWTGSA